jgi:Xaa-Pro dipeptidase
MGLRGDASVMFGSSSALPHGSREEQVLREGMGVMIDDGTTVEGYQSDVTRMGVLGKPPDKLQHAFEIVRSAQDAALAAAIAGRECGSVDDAARKVITDAGFGPAINISLIALDTESEWMGMKVRISFTAIALF